MLRFEVADLNRVITNAVANADLYRAIQADRGNPADWKVLPLSCFAVTVQWQPKQLAADTGFRSYRLATARSVTDAGFELWPPEIYIDNTLDPRNDVHYDLIVAAGPGLIDPALLTGDKGARRAARVALTPYFERVLDVLGEPIDLLTDGRTA